ncbi:hypothetical protein MFIFM68171_02152 [Madurella fahalii]|uniref:Uncharacterized protein n=1 Tax=Madurella fahalii TaxID=1157608 RepID=A0ABQ0G2I5_9PEZI
MESLIRELAVVLCQGLGKTVELALLTQPTGEQPKRPDPVAPLCPETVVPLSVDPAPTPSPPTPRPPRGWSPSFVIKAYMMALKSKLTPESSLDAINQALFVAMPPEKGVFLDVADEYLNEMVYQVANATQREDTIEFTFSGDFFHFVSHHHRIGEVGAPEIYTCENDLDVEETEESCTELEVYHAARVQADKEFEKLYNDFKATPEQEPFQQYLDRYGDNYKRAWDARDEAASKLEQSDLIRPMLIFDSAQSRAKPLHGQNMRSTLKSVSASDSGRRKPVMEDDIFYRPLHTLFGYRDAVSKWHEQYLQRIGKPNVIELDLVQAFDTQWADLGFPAFDSCHQSLSGIDRANLRDMMNKGLKATLTYTHMEAFRVVRGLW